MANMGKWIGTGLGFAMGGPIGALLGFIIGSFFDTPATIKPIQANRQTDQRTYRQTGRADFLYSLVILSTAVMKADGKVTRIELNYVKVFFRQNFGEDGEREALAIIKELLNKEIDIDQIALQIRYNMNLYSREQLLYFLFGVAKSDGTVCINELKLLERIADLLGLSSIKFNSIKSMFYDDLESAYAILGVSPSSDNEEIKKAYRKMAREHHPDKVGYMGEDIRKAAEEKFMTINNAYEKIKKERAI